MRIFLEKENKMDLEDKNGREERFTELCREKEKDIWLELQDEGYAAKMIYAHGIDADKMLADIFAIVAKYKDDKSDKVLDCLVNIYHIMDAEVEKVAEFETKKIYE